MTDHPISPQLRDEAARLAREETQPTAQRLLRLAADLLDEVAHKAQMRRG